MSKKVELIEVTQANVSETGFFCYMSKRKTEGFRRKFDWVRARFDEGLRIKMLKLPERGFIEYIPGEFAWRAVNGADHFMFIHCLWVVGKSKNKGFGGLLIDECLQDAKRSGMAGAAMVTSEGTWLAGKELLLKQGFKPVAEALPSFTLVVKSFKSAPLPSFPDDWEERAKRFGKGLTVLRSDQCPYLEDATMTLLDAAAERGIRSRAVELTSAAEAKRLSPSPYGVFNVVLDGRLLSYRYLLKDEFFKMLKT
ncbi:MAG: GNAT family N-acetyltransferase [Candidatus Aminicenantes bacterium]|nr:GNAT family N-acetyltransferase [Candidatus Aminicenantes bacterium]